LDKIAPEKHSSPHSPDDALILAKRAAIQI
jgi:hypothetical protein